MKHGGHLAVFLSIIFCMGFLFPQYSDADDPDTLKTVDNGANDYRMAEFHQNYFVNSIGMEFKLLTPGTFIMGSLDGNEDEMPVHKITISKPFHMGIFEVTQKQWEQIMGRNPSKFKGSTHPVENISWNEVQKFIKKLSEKEGVRYRLPTEAEWEYACRAGTKTRYYWGDEFNEAYAWYIENSDMKTHPVGLKKPNAWGLYDMSGNVWEWCLDRYDEYSTERLLDPEKSEGNRRIGRGGGWNSSKDACRSSNRGSNHSFRSFDALGFRVVRAD